MLSAVGTLPQLPPIPGSDLVPSAKYAIPIPAEVGSPSEWRNGAVLSAIVRYDNDQILLKVGDRFFTSRPIPGVAEYSRLALQVARDMSGKLMLVPLLPLAGGDIARIGGAPSSSASAPSQPSVEALALHRTAVPLNPISVTPAAGRPQIQALATSLRLPQVLLEFLLQGLRPRPSAAAPLAVAGEELLSAPLDLPSILHMLESGLAQSGLYFEARLKDRRPISGNDLKKKVLDNIGQEGSAALQAWDALDEMLGLQTAATLADELGGTCLSFVLPSQDGVGGWWITFQQDQVESGVQEDGGKDAEMPSRYRPWRIRLVGVALPIGELEIQVQQSDSQNIGVTVLCQKMKGDFDWESPRSELERRLEGEGLHLAHWSVVNASSEAHSESGKTGMFRSVVI